MKRGRRNLKLTACSDGDTIFSLMMEYRYFTVCYSFSNAKVSLTIHWWMSFELVSRDPLQKRLID